MKFTIETFPDISNGEIKQALVEEIEGTTRRLTEWVLRTREAAVREALIKLGWTPPPDPMPNNAAQGGDERSLP